VSNWIRGEETIDGMATGDWDAATAAANDVIARVEAGYTNYLVPACREIRARIRLARGDDEGALADSARAIELGRDSDPQISGGAFATRAFVLLSLGDRDGASDVASEAAARPASFYGSVELAAVLHDLERGDQILPWAAGLNAPPWHAAVEAIAAGDFVAAAEIFDQIGDRTHEAYFRLRSGRDVDVRSALEFYRSVGATRYVREGEALLAATA
jgi:hypothetical protein